jgi:outer membrane lipoprotein-sorting protein
MKRAQKLCLAVPLILSLMSTGCLFRSRRVPQRVVQSNLRSATLQELVQMVNERANQIHTLNATVDIDASAGGSVKGKITEYKEIRGYILIRQPNELRMIGLMPIVRNRAFDMVSNGGNFKLWIPPTNKFFVGSAKVVRPSKNPLENLRPEVIYEALTPRAIDPVNEIAVLENASETIPDPNSKKKVIEQPQYVVDVIRKDNGGWYLDRKLVFDRSDLLIHQQIVYDTRAYVATDVHYGAYKDYNGISFPSDIDIWRPQEEYSIGLIMVKLAINAPISDSQFALEQPPGVVLVQLDNPSPNQQQGKGDGQR